MTFSLNKHRQEISHSFRVWVVHDIGYISYVFYMSWRSFFRFSSVRTVFPIAILPLT